MVPNSKQPPNPNKTIIPPWLKRAVVVSAVIMGMFSLIVAVIYNCDKLGLCTPPPPPFDVIISEPQDSGIVKKNITVTGTIVGTIPENKYLWLLVGFAEVHNWWPQSNQSILATGDKWYKSARIDIPLNSEQQIAVVLVNSTVDEKLADWWNTANRTNNWSFWKGTPGEIYDAITVIKGPDDLIVNITRPYDGETVVHSINVTGTILGDIPENNYLWLLVGLENEHQWWPQTGNIIPIGRGWKIPAKIGGGPDMSKDLEFKLVVMLVDEKVNQELIDRTREGKIMGLPYGAVLDEIYINKGEG